jgi:hypothetical protein
LLEKLHMIFGEGGRTIYLGSDCGRRNILFMPSLEMFIGHRISASAPSIFRSCRRGRTFIWSSIDDRNIPITVTTSSSVSAFNCCDCSLTTEACESAPWSSSRRASQVGCERDRWHWGRWWVVYKAWRRKGFFAGSITRAKWLYRLGSCSCQRDFKIADSGEIGWKQSSK